MPNRDSIVASAIVLAVVAAGVVVYVLSSPEPELTFETASPSAEPFIGEDGATISLPEPSVAPEAIAGATTNNTLTPAPQPVSASAATGPADWGMAGMLAVIIAGLGGMIYATKEA